MIPLPQGVRVWLATGHTDMKILASCHTRYDTLGAADHLMGGEPSES